MKNLILVSHLDVLKEKNLRDFICLNNIYDYNFHIFSYRSSSITHRCLTQLIYKKNLVKRFYQYLKFVWNCKSHIHHVEVYTGCGNFWIIECLICFLIGIKIIICERGTPLLVIGDNPCLIRLLKKFVLKYLSSRIWIRELWMSDKLKSMNIPLDKTALIPNAIEVNKSFNELNFNHSIKSFLWVNTFKEFRHLGWVHNTFKELSSRTCDFQLTIIGDLSSNNIIPCPVNQDYAQKLKYISSTVVLPFLDPFVFYTQHTFFILPADIVYLNNSLLEAMSFGCIPIISNVQGAELIVPDKKYGILFKNNQESFNEAIHYALTLSSSDITSMKVNIKKHLIENFSLKSKAQKLAEMYRSLS